VFSPGPYLHLSSHLDERIKGYRDPKRAAAELLKLLEHRHFDWVIVADDDLLRALLETSDRAKLAPWFPFDPFGDAGRLLTSKFGFAAEAARAGIPAPESTLAESVPIVAAYASVFGYPVVLKGDRGFAGLEVDVVWDEETLRVKSAVHLARYGRVLVQRFVPGVSASACVLYQRGALAAYKAYRSECCYPTPTSASTVHDYFSHPALESIVRTVGTVTGFHGLLGIDFMHDEKTDRLYAIEINPRPTIGFSGTATNRAFFTPFVADFLSNTPGRGVAYDGHDPTQSYFPGYLFYFLTRADRSEPGSKRRLKACLNEYRREDWRLACWEIVRFARDRAWGALRALVNRDAPARTASLLEDTQSHEAREFTTTSN